MTSLESKYKKLKELLQQYEKIAVAFSGGVDSTLLVHAAMNALGQDKVTALYALSTLNSAESIASTRAIFAKNFTKGAVLREVEVFPLGWQDFVMNSPERCYVCKKQLYTVLQTSMAAEGCLILADGTNVNDVQEVRPGLQAIRELQVRTPFVEVGFTKPEIRRLAEEIGLSNFDLPANSCLATRIQQHLPITEETLRTIEKAENFLHLHGFHGCRVRIGNSFLMIELQEKDFVTFCQSGTRATVQSYFETLQVGPVMLNLAGR